MFYDNPYPSPAGKAEYRRRAEEMFTATCNEANPYLYLCPIMPIMDAKNLYFSP